METWKEIKGFPGYEISDQGRVCSLKFKRQPYFHKVRLNADGYPKATLYKDGKAYEFRVHGLVASHFVSNTHGLGTVNHKNGIKTDNRAENLEWMDRHEQMKHAYKLGLKKPMQGTKSPHSKLTEEDVRYIRRVCVKYSQEFGTSALARKFGVDDTIIGKIVNGVSYRNVK